MRNRENKVPRTFGYPSRHKSTALAGAYAVDGEDFRGDKWRLYRREICNSHKWTTVIQRPDLSLQVTLLCVCQHLAQARNVSIAPVRSCAPIYNRQGISPITVTIQQDVHTRHHTYRQTNTAEHNTTNAARESKHRTNEHHQLALQKIMVRCH